MKCSECGKEFIAKSPESAVYWIDDFRADFNDDNEPICPACADPLFDEVLEVDDEYDL